MQQIINSFSYQRGKRYLIIELNTIKGWDI